MTSLNVSRCGYLQRIECYKNQITGDGMTTLVNSLPPCDDDQPGVLLAIYNTDEGNTMNAAQITTAINQRWLPYKYVNGTWVLMSPDSYTRGDVNGDTVVNISDAIALINYVSTNNSTGLNLDAADCNNDHSVNITDALTLINYLLTETW